MEWVERFVPVQVAIAFLAALPLGWASERGPSSGGLRAHPLVAACVCGFLAVARSFASGPREQADVFYGVLSGLGLVGAGAIVKARAEVRGLNTAVSLWVAGAIGAAVACGVAVLALVLSLVTALTLRWPSPGERLRRT